MHNPDDSEKFIPFTSDYGFKATFGNDHNTIFLKRALQALMQSEVPIEEVHLLPNELQAVSKDGRGGIYDLACRDNHGNRFLVEMQVAYYPDFIHRMKYYSFYQLNSLIQKGDYFYNDLPKIYCIGILAFVLYPKLPHFHNTIVLKNQDGELIDDQITYITVELPKFTKPLQALSSDLDILLYTMKTVQDTPKDPIKWPEIWNEEWIRIALDELNKRSMTPDELAQYHYIVMRNATIVREENRRMKEAEQQGMEQGMQQGMQKGMQQGIEKGKQQSKEEIVKEGLKKGLSPELLADITHLPLDFVLRVAATQK